MYVKQWISDSKYFGLKYVCVCIYIYTHIYVTGEIFTVLVFLQYLSYHYYCSYHHYFLSIWHLQTHNQFASCAVFSSSLVFDSLGTSSANISSDAFFLFSSFSACSAMVLIQWAMTSCSCVWSFWLCSRALLTCRWALCKRSPTLVLVNSDPVEKT